MSHAMKLEGPFAIEEAGGRAALCGRLRVEAPVVFLPGLRLRVEGAGEVAADSRDTHYLGWLPRGAYRVRAFLPGSLGAGAHRFSLEAVHREAMADAAAAKLEGAFTLAGPAAAPADGLAWSFETVAPGVAIENLSWKRGHEDWFFRHFDHAAATVVSYMLADSPKLRGRILDVGCGDGITALGVALRTGCEELVAIDPFRGFDRLPEILRANHLPADAIPKRVKYLGEDANFLPFADDSFDVVISWAAVEHFAGGYLQALREMKRVLRPGGLLFIHPGLYYCNAGHHLAEYSTEPFFHLRKSRDEIRAIVFGAKPRYEDRAGETPTPAQHWQWFNELNPITVTRFEQELRALEFEPWRVAIRTEGLVEYTPETLAYPMQDLATNELYVSCVNRKRPKP
ncbi:MAG: class I SAM-dependent methyltransferase [Burkholderiales bacterium]|jgi:ubiquinone/menaquinone biosynthesis C-methylase UbiE|nr:class I SAM-dependent methyltransferase [Burkholderiales bacterium]